MKPILIALCVLLSACNLPDPSMQMREQDKNADAVSVESSERIQVTRIGVFADTLAYHDLRGVYLIKDTKTGAEYIGISGVGIQETGSHNCGKNCTSEDER